MSHDCPSNEENLTAALETVAVSAERIADALEAIVELMKPTVPVKEESEE